MAWPACAKPELRYGEGTAMGGFEDFFPSRSSAAGRGKAAGFFVGLAFFFLLCYKYWFLFFQRETANLRRA
jgi:hypothetical protein